LLKRSALANKMIKRIFDILIVLTSLVIVLPLTFITFLLVKLTSKGPTLYWSQRVGIYNQLFDMPKFRSMRINTPALATHLLNKSGNANKYLTPVGGFLRKLSLDEIPQLWSVLKGDMSIVGPRPALFNQEDLIELRTKYGVDKLRPGITGWAQINGRDEIPISKKVELDYYYLTHQSLIFDIYIILLTVFKVLRRDNVSH
jgi:O-antigen biosynthesis protein WbqP